MKIALLASVDSQKGRILGFFKNNPKEKVLALRFCQDPNDKYFVGYKAPTRINELVRIKILNSELSDLKSKFGGHFHEYSLQKNVKIIYRDGCYEVSKKTSLINRLYNNF